MPLTFFPHRHLQVRTPLPCDEVLRRLSEVVEPKQWFRFPFFGKHRPYEGVVSANGFRISRVIDYRNSFLPMIDGRVSPDAHGTVVDVSLSLHPFTSVFMAVWLGLTGVLGIVFLVGVLLGHGSGEPVFSLVPLGMCAFGYLLMHGGFAFEVGPVRKLLHEVTTS